MLSIRKSTRRPFSWSIARKLTISASARAAAGAGGAARAGSACGFDEGGFWRAGSSRPIRTRTDNAKVASVRYGRKGSVAGATAAPFTAKISRTPRIKATLIADAYLCCSLVRLKYVIGDYNRCANQEFWSRPAAFDPSTSGRPTPSSRPTPFGGTRCAPTSRRSCTRMRGATAAGPLFPAGDARRTAHRRVLSGPLAEHTECVDRARPITGASRVQVLEHLRCGRNGVRQLRVRAGAVPGGRSGC